MYLESLLMADRSQLILHNNNYIVNSIATDIFKHLSHDIDIVFPVY